MPLSGGTMTGPLYTIGNTSGIVPVCIKSSTFNFLGAINSFIKLYDVPAGYTFVASTWSIYITNAAGAWSAGATMPLIDITNSTGSHLAGSMPFRGSGNTYVTNSTDLQTTFGGLQTVSTDIVKAKITTAGNNTGYTSLSGIIIVNGYLIS